MDKSESVMNRALANYGKRTEPMPLLCHRIGCDHSGHTAERLGISRPLTIERTSSENSEQLYAGGDTAQDIANNHI